MYCARTTNYYCYPKLDTRLGSKKCTEGWKEIPFESEPKAIEKTTHSGRLEACGIRGTGCKII